MHPYPHHYVASAAGRVTGSVTISASGLQAVATAPPPEFGGPSGIWSPETLLTAAVADCFVLTFRAVARAVHFEWLKLDCRVDGTLERIEGQVRFTAFETMARLTVPRSSEMTKARHLLEQAEHGCLIANSLRAERVLSIEVLTASEVTEPA